MFEFNDIIVKNTGLLKLYVILWCYQTKEVAL